MKKRVLIFFTATSLCSLLLVPCSTNAQVPSYVPTSGLVGWWPFNGNANDESGNGHNGTPINGVTLSTDRFGITNKAYSFDGIDDYIDVDVNSILTDGITISVWIKSNLPNSQFEHKGIVWSRLSGPGGNPPFPPNQATGVMIHPNGLLSNASDGTSLVTLQDVGQYYNNALWFNIIFCYDSNSGVAKFYVNGSETVSNNTSVLNGIDLAYNTIKIGKDEITGYGNRHWLGSIDDIGIWNRALSQSEVMALYNSCSAPSASITPSGNTIFCQGGSVTLQANTGVGYTYQWYNNGTAIQNATQSSYQATTSGSYTVLVTNGACNTTSAATVVTVNSNPTAVITPSGNTTFCQGGFVTLTASGGLAYNWNVGSTTTSIVATQTGVYTVAATSSNGCIGYASQQVTVNPSPTVTLTGLSAFNNYYGANVSLTGTPTGGSYSGPGVTGNTFSPQTAGLGTAQVSYTYSNASGCSGNATASTIVYDTLGTVCTSTVTVYDTLYTTVTDTLIINTTLSLAPPNDQNTILIYPNPASDHITIDNGNYAAMAGYSIVIENNAGQQVFQSAINEAQFYVDLSSWTGNGLYFVHLFDPTGNTVTVRKIVLQ
jgi:hypothetical protein